MILLISMSVVSLTAISEIHEHLELIEEESILEAQNITTTMGAFRTLYSELVVEPASAFGMEVTHDFENRPNAIPLPITMSRILGDQLAASTSAADIRLFSESPFPWRSDGGTRDEFERQALQYLQANPDDSFSQVEQGEHGRRLRYATADRMGASCVRCHNSHPQSPRTDWKVGDVRGALSITIPMESAFSRAVSSATNLVGLLIGLATLGSAATFVVLRVNKSKLTLVDVVDKQSAALDQSGSEITALLNATADAIIAIDHNGLITTFNAAAESMFGHSAQEALGQNVALLMNAATAGQHDGYLDKYANTGRGNVVDQDREMVGMHRDGSEFPISLRVSKMLHKGESQFVAIIQDITERRRFEERISDLAKIGDECPHPVLRIGADGTVLYANEPSSIVLGSLRCAVGELVPSDWRVLVVNTLASGKIQAHELDCGESLFSFRVVPFADSAYVNLYGQEVTAQRQAEEQLRHDALHDSLTALPNRALLMDRLGKCFEQSTHDSDYRFALLFLDFDGFKVVNDSLGHQVGDQLLIGIAGRLRSCLRSVDSITCPNLSQVARIGGDEFVVLLDDVNSTDDALIVGDRIQAAMIEPFLLQGHKVVTSASIGIACSDRGYDSADDMVRDADAAMYHAKAAGKAQCAVFDPSMHDAAMARLTLEVDLRRALETNQFRLLYQPIFCLKSHDVVSMEAFLRWHHPTRGLMFPEEFIPVAEETGMIVPIGRWVLLEACRQLAEWHRSTSMSRPIAVSINVSRKQISNPGFLEDLEAVLLETQAPRDKVCLEIAETAIMENATVIQEFLVQAKSLGVKLHMDDFGTGYASLSHLHQLPLDVLKMGRSFMDNLEAGIQLAAVVRSVVELAHTFKMQVTAEGIETEEQLTRILELECDFGQGSHFSTPINARDATGFIESQYRIRKSA